MTAVLKKTAKRPTIIPIELSDRHKILIDSETKAIHEILLKFAEKISRYIKINLIESTINAYHNKRGKITSFEFHLQVHPVRGKVLATQVEDKMLMNAVHTAIDKIKHQSNHTH